MEPTITKKGRLTVEKSDHFLRINDHPGQRPVRKSRIIELEEKHKRGVFHVANISIVRVLNGSGHPLREVLINGQHVCHLVNRIGTSVPAIIHYFDLPDGPAVEGKIAELFAQYDEGGLRSAGNIAHMFNKAYNLGYSYKLAPLLASAFAWLENNYSIPAFETKDIRAARLIQCVSEGKFVQSLESSQDDFKHLNRMPTIAAMIAIFRVAGENSRDFWVAVRDGESMRKNNPALRLRDWLKETSVAGTHTKRPSASRHEMYAKCIHAWNAWRKQKPLNKLIWQEKAEMPKPSK